MGLPNIISERRHKIHTVESLYIKFKTRENHTLFLKGTYMGSKSATKNKTVVAANIRIVTPSGRDKGQPKEETYSLVDHRQQAGS